MSLMTERAKWFSRLIHEGEVRKFSGEPYYVHCDSVADATKEHGEKIESASMLHDVIENSKNKELVRLMLNYFFPEDVVYLVETLTNDKNVYYFRYLEVVCNNPEATIIKIQDILNNTKDIDHLEYPEKQKAKYREACLYMIKRGIEIPEILKERLKIEVDYGSKV
jgi:guanosine-3',5'-bis(diphosphate) 3'-pyrophosphohydrolase